MKKILTSLLLAQALLSPAFSQEKQDVPLPGVVVEQNSKRKTGSVVYLPGASVMSAKATPQVSDANGRFTLLFADVPYGNVARIFVKKEGFEVVNAKEMESAAVTGRNSPLKVVLCRSGLLYENQVAYYQIANDAVLEQFQKRVAALEKGGREKDLLFAQLQVEFNQKIETDQEAYVLLQQQYNSTKAQAESLADNWVTVNLDDEAESYQRAFDAFQQKNIELAIAILDSVDLKTRLETNAREKQKEQALIDTLHQSVARREEQTRQDVNQCMFKAQLHVLKYEFEMAREMYELAVSYDSVNIDNLWEVAYFLAEQNDYQPAIHLYRKALELAASESTRAALLNNLGALLYANQSFAEAEAAYREALKIRRALAEKNPDAFLPDEAGSLNNLGLLLKANQSFAEAEAAYREALKTYRVLAEKNPDAFLPDVAGSLNNLGILLKANQSFAEAEAAFREALKIRRALAEKNPDAFLPDVATSLNNLGNLLYTNQSFAEAEAAYREALKIRRALAEKNSDAFLPDVAGSLNNLGILLSDNQSFAEAEATYREALKIRRALAEKNPDAFLPDVAESLNNLGILLSDNQSFAEAEAAFREALKIRRALAEKNPDAFLPGMAMTLNNLGLLLSDNQAFGEAEAAYREALKIYRTLAEKNPDAFLPYVATSLNNLGILLSDNQSFAEAEATYREALKIRRALAEKNPDAFLPEVATSLNNLGILLYTNKSFDEAEQAYREALKTYRALAEKNPDAFLPGVAGTLNNLGALLSDNQSFGEAEQAYREALEIRRALAEKNPDAFNLNVCATDISLAIFHKDLLESTQDLRHKNEGLELLADAEKRLARFPAAHPTVKNYLGKINYWKEYFQNVTPEGLRQQAKIARITALEGENQHETDPARQVEQQKEIVQNVEGLLVEVPDNQELQNYLASACGSLAWYHLFARQSQEAEAAAKKGLAADPSQEWINTNLALALLYQGKWTEAQAVYETWKAKPYDEKTTWAAVFLKDLDDLEAAGITHPDAAKARVLLKD